MSQIDDDEFNAAQAEVRAEARERAEERPPTPFEQDALLLAQNEAEAEYLDEWRQDEFMKAVNDWATDAAGFGVGPVEVPYHIWSGPQAGMDAYLVRKYRTAHPAPKPAPARRTPPPPPKERARPPAESDQIQVEIGPNGVVLPPRLENRPITNFREMAKRPRLPEEELPRTDDPDGWRSR